jgi:uncharacterized protein YceK
MKDHGSPMKMICLMLLGGISLGLSGCANQGPIVAYDVPTEGAAVAARDNRLGYEEPAAWVPTK